jgi:DNA-binding NarL/FixJ family response regulator
MHAKMKPKLLIVEDNPVMRDTLYRILKRQFPMLNINKAGNGREAFIQIHHHLPDLILMDIQMPGENGLQLTRKLKDLYPQIIIIVVTNYDLPEYREAAMKSGADSFILKSSLKKQLGSIIKSKLAESGFNYQ